MMRRLSLEAQAKWTKKLEKLERQCDARGISILDLSEMAGLERRTVYKWGKYHQLPRRSCWAKVQQTLATLPVKAQVQKQLPLEIIKDPVAIAAAMEDKPTIPSRVEFIDVPKPREAEAREVIISLIYDKLKGMEIVQLALTLSYVSAQS